jgi:SAM-dependent methyltransferase
MSHFSHQLHDRNDRASHDARWLLLQHAESPRKSDPCPASQRALSAPLRQGFHWFANEDALREIHRVLRGCTGALALFWNREDDGVPWAADLLGVFEPLSRGIPQYWTGDWVKVWRGTLAQQLFDVPGDDPRSRSKFFRCETP